MSLISRFAATIGRHRKFRQWPNWVLVWACWMVVALFYLAELLIGATGGHTYDIPRLSFQLFINSNVWFGFTFLVVKAVRRVPLLKNNWAKPLVFHLVFFAFVSTSQVATYSVISHMLGLRSPARPLFDGFQSQVAGLTTTNLAYYAAIFIITNAVDYYRKYRLKDLAASQLEMRLTQSQLRMLRMQLHPHFLFNTLNTISVLMEKDIKAANRMLVRLSELLRTALEDIGAQEVTLKQEVDFLQRYLEIEQIRFKDRLEIEIAIEPYVLDALVPNLLLQPLVENAIRHGIAPKLSDGVIKIGAVREGESLKVYVSDNGPGLQEETDSVMRKGIGLSNTAERLQQLYGEKHSFQIKNAEEEGVIATVIIPFRTKPEDRSREQTEFVGHEDSNTDS